MKDYIKKSLKSSNGITLIALVITIIVLLILAGISISMLSGDNSILQKSTTAKQNSEKAQIEERIQLAYHSALAGGQGSYTKDTLMQELKNEFETDYDVDDSNDEKWKMKAHGQEVEVPAGIKEEEEEGTNKIYSLGEEVTVGGEKFFVITENDKKSNDKITLLSKYNLSTEEPNKQVNAENSDTKILFCIEPDDSYFASIGSIPAPFDLNELESDKSTAINKAKSYGITKGGTGKLLTYSEVDNLKSKIEKIIYGTYTGTDAVISDGFLSYWLSTVVGEELVYYVDGQNKNVTPYFIYEDGSGNEYHGVRPVIEILKSKISE